MGTSSNRSPTGNANAGALEQLARVELVARAGVDAVEQTGLLGERVAEDAHVGLGVVDAVELPVQEVLDAADHEVGTGRDGAVVHALEHRGRDDVVAVDEREVGAPSVLHPEVARIPQTAVGLRERPDEPGELWRCSRAMMAAEPSVEPSSTTTISKSAWVCATQRVEALGQIALDVVDGHDDRDGGRSGFRCHRAPPGRAAPTRRTMRARRSSRSPAESTNA